MRREEIIAKGAYTAPQFGELISVKQFIMLRRKGEKYLLLRLCNDRTERADAVCFCVKQYDVKGNLVGVETIVNKSISAAGGEDFALDNTIKLNKACIDFAVEMVYATYGNYTYRLYGGALTATYENKTEDLPVDKQSISKRMRGHASRVQGKTFNAPKLMVASMALILLIVGVFAFFQLKNFMATEELFTLDSVEYRFETDNHIDGPISIVRYKGKAGNVIVPASIEGHTVAGIADGAFEGKPLKSITVYGSLYIGQRAFAECRYMDTVEIGGVTEIGDGAFSGCSSIRKITLNDKITAINASTFEGCDSLAEVNIPTGLVSLGEKAFKDCKSLTAVVLPDTLTDVGQSAFENCRSLVSLTAPYAGGQGEDTNYIGYFFGGEKHVPETLTSIVLTQVTEIGESAFAGCHRVVSIALPETVTAIGEVAFSGCEALTNFKLPDGLTSVGAGAFSDCASLTEVHIPAGVRVISKNMFAGCRGIRSLTIASGVEAIEKNAFKNCTGITKLEIPASVMTLQADVLSGCAGIEEISLPFIGMSVEEATPLSTLFGRGYDALKTVTVLNARSIADKAFEGFNNLTAVSLSGNVESIGQEAFQNCANLQTVLLPDTVTEMGIFAFRGCTSLVSVKLPDQLTVVRQGLFYACTALTDVEVPEGVKAVEGEAFANCSALKDATWLGSVESMGESVFAYCTALERVSLPAALTKIENDSFNGCTALREVAIPAAVTVIGERAFYGCTGLQTLTISGKTEEIMKEAFVDCSSLIAIDLPSTLHSIGDGAFGGCSSVRELKVPESVTTIGQEVAARCSSLEKLTVPFLGQTISNPRTLSYLVSTVVPQTLTCVNITGATAIADSAFMGCQYITTIQLNEGIVSIGSNAFRDCSVLETIAIPSTVSYIGSRAFISCRALQEITIPDSVTSLEPQIFNGCDSLAKITVPFIGGSRDVAQPLAYFFDGFSVSASLTEVTLTNAQFLADWSFDGCGGIETLTLDCDVLNIGTGAFRNCYSLEVLGIPDTVETIGTNAFEGCSGIRSITIPKSVTYIGNDALLRCTALEEVVIPFVGNSRTDSTVFAILFGDLYGIPESLHKVTVTDSSAVKDYAFADMQYVEEVVYEQTIESIGIYAFSYCHALLELPILDAVTVIADYAFQNCDSLVCVEIPDGVESLGYRCFAECDLLETVVVPDSVTQMGGSIFFNCQQLTELTIPFVGGSADDSNGLAYLFENQWNIPQTLKKVAVTNSTVVKDYAFADMQYVEEVVYTQDVTAIGTDAFRNCTVLKNSVIGNAVVTIGNGSFYGCHAIKSVTIPATCQSVGSGAFGWCPALYEVYNQSELSFGMGDASELLNHCLVYRTDDTEVKKAVSGGVELVLADNGTWYVVGYTGEGSSVSLPVSFLDGETDVVSYAIAPHVFRNRKDIRSVVIPASVSEIGSEAFYDCTNLLEVYNLSALPIVRGDYSNGCVAYYAYIIHDEAEEEPLNIIQIGDFQFAKSGDNWFLERYLGSGEEVILGSLAYEGGTVDAYEVVRNAFKDAYYVTSIVMTDAVKDIEKAAFRDLGLRLVSFEDNVSLTNIREQTFAYCYNLEQVILPASLESISYDAFCDCSALREIYNLSSLALETGSTEHGRVAEHAIVIHDSMDDPAVVEVDIGDYIFLNSGDIWSLWKYEGQSANIVLGSFEYNGVTIDSYSIFSKAFNGNAYIASVVIGDEVQSIGKYAFSSCNRLKSVSFEDNTSITTIRPYTFSNNRNLDRVVLPASLTEIQYDAFWGCDNLLEVYNLSSLTLTLGDYGNGCVARYAKVIHTSMDEAGLNIHNRESNGYTYKFIEEDGTWKMYARIQHVWDWKYILPEFVVGDVVREYEVTANISGYSMIVIPSSVTKLDFTMFTGNEICYRGTAEELADLADGVSLSHCTVRYYADCVHEEGKWSYDSAGNVITTINYSSYTITESTCQQKGVNEYICSYCQETWRQEHDYFGAHSFNENHICQVCSDTFESRPLEDVWTVTNDTQAPFSITGGGEIVSTNRADGSTATLTLEAKADAVFTYRYYTSTEGGCDVLVIRKNGIQLVRTSGIMAEYSQGITIEVVAGDVITIAYSKDGSVAHGEDVVKVADMVYLVGE